MGTAMNGLWSLLAGGLGLLALSGCSDRFTSCKDTKTCALAGGGGTGGVAASEAGSGGVTEGGAPSAGAAGIPESSGGTAGDATTSGGSAGAGGSGGTNSGPPCVLDALIGKVDWEQIYSKQRSSFYTYEALCKALETPELKAFANSGNIETDKREVAAFFAHVSVHSGELKYIKEIVPSDPQYYGRGPLAITYKYNYEGCSKTLGLGQKLVQNPELLETDPVLTWECSLWYWLYSDSDGPSGPNTTCHDKMVKDGNFGETVRIINAIDCGGATAERRKNYYKSYCTALGLPEPTRNLDC